MSMEIVYHLALNEGLTHYMSSNNNDCGFVDVQDMVIIPASCIYIKPTWASTAPDHRSTFLRSFVSCIGLRVLSDDTIRRPEPISRSLNKDKCLLAASSSFSRLISIGSAHKSSQNVLPKSLTLKSDYELYD